MIKTTYVDMTEKDPMTQVLLDDDGTYWCPVTGVFENIDEFCKFCFYTYILEEDQSETTMQFVGRVFMRPDPSEEAEEGYFIGCEPSHPEAVEMWEIVEVERDSKDDENSVLIVQNDVEYKMIYDEEKDETIVVNVAGVVLCRFVGKVSEYQASETLKDVLNK